ncbi:helix-turn-helix transcriptional regulator [Alicyclobacillus fastidiosus]|uniref:Helix-turn-helix transcriptional regulator n=1 Tax=Alicyclobacillus fastidiosus TaxID=392011 RepID=A0ABV5A9H6_9BACL|nr:helix-turn-helix transcriptional regulator [Alicyclobacillus fastidiosus]WEH10849.1 helix-turn-helix transcriptional regulator [Alicyclobacillus fastidiosus]
MYNLDARTYGGESVLEYTKRQSDILKLVQERGPITGDQIADALGVSKLTLRSDLSVLTMTGRLRARPRVGYTYNESHEAESRLSVLHELMVSDFLAVPVSVSESCSVYDAAVTMFLEDVGTLCVVDNAHLVGVLSRKDLLKVTLGGSDTKSLPVTLAMTRVPHVVTVSPESSLYDAALLMVRHEVDALPVIKVSDSPERGTEVIGRISKTTITRAFVELGQKFSV